MFQYLYFSQKHKDLLVECKDSVNISLAQILFVD